MRRSTRLLIGFLAAALTYGALAAVVGPRPFRSQGWHPYQAYGANQPGRCDGTHRGGWRQSPDSPRERETPPASPAPNP